MDLASKAVQSQPNAAAMHDTVAFVQMKRKDYKSAAASLRSAMMLEPDRFIWRFNLAEALALAGDRGEASRMLSDIVSLLPTLKSVPPDAVAQIDRLRARVQAGAATRPATTMP